MTWAIHCLLMPSCCDGCHWTCNVSLLSLLLTFQHCSSINRKLAKDRSDLLRRMKTEDHVLHHSFISTVTAEDSLNKAFIPMVCQLYIAFRIQFFFFFVFWTHLRLFISLFCSLFHLSQYPLSVKHNKVNVLFTCSVTFTFCIWYSFFTYSDTCNYYYYFKIFYNK